MRASITLFASLALALAACGSETSGTFEGEDGETGEYTIDTATGEASATIETEDGTFTMRSGSDVPIDLPDGFSVYPGAEIVTNTVVNQSEGSGTLVTMNSADSPAKIKAFYKAQAEAAGVTIQMDMTTNGMEMVGGEAPDGLTFSAMIMPEGEGSTVQLTVGRQPE